eukprot:6025770-Pyramimonas_sp.AAC.1
MAGSVWDVYLIPQNEATEQSTEMYYLATGTSSRPQLSSYSCNVFDGSAPSSGIMGTTSRPSWTRSARLVWMNAESAAVSTTLAEYMSTALPG